MRATHQDLLQDTIRIVQSYGPRCSFILSLLRTNDPRQFQEILMAISELDRQKIDNNQNFIFGEQGRRISYFINRKLKELIDWEKINSKKLINSFAYMKEIFYFGFMDDNLEERFQDLFDLLDITNRKLRWMMQPQLGQAFSFLKASMDALFINKYSTTQQQKISRLDERKGKQFQIMTINTHNNFIKKKDLKNTEYVFGKYKGTNSPRLFFLLLDMCLPQFGQIKQQIAKLALNFNGQQWELVGQCRVNKQCLTQTNLIKSLSTFSKDYKYLYQNFFLQVEDKIVFKYDILKLKINKNHHFQMKYIPPYDKDMAFDLQQIIQTSIKLMKDILLNKRLFIFNGSGIDQIALQDREKVILFCLHLITFPFRVRFTNHDKLKEQQRHCLMSHIEFQLPIQLLRQSLLEFMDYCLTESSISIDFINRLSELFRWIHETPEFQSHFEQLFSSNNVQKSLGELFFKLIKKYLSEKECCQLPYHTGIWLIDFLIFFEYYEEQSYGIIFQRLYYFLVRNTRYYSIYEYQLEIMMFREQLQQTFFVKVDKLLMSRPNFSKVISCAWLKQLELFEKKAGSQQSQRERRLHMFALIVKCEYFPVTQQIKSRMTIILHIQELALQSQLTGFYKVIWKAYFMRAGIDLSSLLQKGLHQIQKDMHDHNLMANMIHEFHFRSQRPSSFNHLIKYLSHLKIAIDLMDNITEESIGRIVTIVFHVNCIKFKYQQARIHTLDQLTIHALQRFQQLEQYGFSTDMQDSLNHHLSTILTNIENVKDIKVCNAIVVQLGRHIDCLRKDYENPQFVASHLHIIDEIVRNLSDQSKCQFFPQFYNFHKDAILDLFHKLFSYYQFRVSQEFNKDKLQKEIDLVLELKQQKKIVRIQCDKLHVSHLLHQIKKILQRMFTNQQWQSTFLINNIKYEKVNSSKLIQKSLQSDLIGRMAANFSIQNVQMYDLILRWINYNNNSTNEILLYQTTTVSVSLPDDPIIIFHSKGCLSDYLERQQMLLQKIIKNRANYDCIKVHQSYKTLAKALKQQIRNELSFLFLKELFQQLLLRLTEYSFNWKQYYETNCYIQLILDSCKQQIQPFLSKQLLSQYLSQIMLDLEGDVFRMHSPDPFINIIERILPKKQPECVDRDFKSFANITLFLYCKLYNYKEKESRIVAFENLVNYILSFQQWEYLYQQQIIQLFSHFHQSSDKFSTLFCKLVSQQLAKPSMELQIKAQFLKDIQKNKDSKDYKGVKLIGYMKAFQDKCTRNEAEFIQISSEILHKKVIKNSEDEQTYVMLRQVQKIGQSSSLKCSFMDYPFSKTIKMILAEFIEKIGSDKELLKLKLKELRIIMFNYPILIQYILMHPYKFKNQTIAFFDYLLRRVTQQTLDIEVYDFFYYSCLDRTLIVQLEGKNMFYSECLCFRLIYNITHQKCVTHLNIIFIFYMSKLKRFAQACFRKIIQDQSLCDWLWKYLSDQNIQGGTIIVYSILSILYRYSSVKSILHHCEYQRDQDETIVSMFIKECTVPFNNVFLRSQVDQGQISIKGMHYDGTNHQIYALSEKNQKFWDLVEDLKIQTSNRYVDLLKIFYEQIQIKNQYFKVVGHTIQRISVSKYKDIQSFINDTAYTENHQQMFSNFYEVFLDHGQKRSDELQKIKAAKGYCLFDNLGQAKKVGTQSCINKAWNKQMNKRHQSQFAPQDFFQAQHKQDQSDQNRLVKLLQSKILQVCEQTQETQIKVFSDKITDLLIALNEKLQRLQSKQLTIEDVKGKNQSQKINFLQRRYVQADFDCKQAEMSIEQFQLYCLIQAHSANMLDQARLNKIKSIQESMLLQFIEKPGYQNCIDHIIDTIDQNYQHLPKNIPSILPANVPINSKVHEKRYIQSHMLPLDAFITLEDDKLGSLIFSVFCSTNLIPIDYLTPFLENKQIQQRLVNNLLQIYNRPLTLDMFPSSIALFSYEDRQFTMSQNTEDDANQLRQKILEIFKKGANRCFYKDYNYLNWPSKAKGIDECQLSQEQKPLQQEILSINNVIELIMKKDFGQQDSIDFLQYFRLFNNVKELPNETFERLIQLMTLFNQKFIKLSSQNEENSHESKRKILKDYEQYQLQFSNSLLCLMTDGRIKQQVRKAFDFHLQNIDSFFITLFMSVQVYQRQQLLAHHKKIIESDESKLCNIYFANKAFSLYTDQQLTSCLWIRQSKNIISSLIKTFSQSNELLRNQPFYRLCKFSHLTTIQFKTDILQQRIMQFTNQFQFDGSSQIVAKRKVGIFQSAFIDLRSKPDGFWFESFKVKFMNQDDEIESGYGSGVAKDWYSLVTRGMVNLDYGLFMKTSKNYYFFNRESWINPRNLQYLEFVGKLFAISIIKKDYFVTPSFSILLYKMILGEQIKIEDIIEEFDEGEVINNLEKLREMADNTLILDSFVYEDKRLIAHQDLQVFRRTKSGQRSGHNLYLIQEAVQVRQSNQMQEEQMIEIKQPEIPYIIKVVKVGEMIELMPGGASIEVTMNNRDEYIQLTKSKILEIVVNQIKPPFQAFMSGFRHIVQPNFIEHISAQDLRSIAEGTNKIQISELRNYVSINKNIAKSNELQWLWQCLQNLSAENKACFIQHWTGLPKIPAEGFKEMNLNIVRGGYGDRLFAQTCFNKLHLPEFKSYEEVSQAVMTAVNSVKVGRSVIQD